jgi:hypothetical protein
MLHHSERLCLALMLANTAAFAGIGAGFALPESLKLPLLGGFVLFFVLVLVALGHLTPLARARRPSLSDLDEPEGLSATDFRTLLTLAPRHQKTAALVGLAALVTAVMAFGGVSWTTGTPFGRHHAMGIALYVAALASLLYPLLGALSRLPASLEDRIRVLQRHDA